MNNILHINFQYLNATWPLPRSDKYNTTRDLEMKDNNTTIDIWILIVTNQTLALSMTSKKNIYHGINFSTSNISNQVKLAFLWVLFIICFITLWLKFAFDYHFLHFKLCMSLLLLLCFETSYHPFTSIVTQSWNTTFISPLANWFIFHWW